jgi:hypothetical protein
MQHATMNYVATISSSSVQVRFLFLSCEHRVVGTLTCFTHSCMYALALFQGLIHNASELTSMLRAPVGAKVTFDHTNALEFTEAVIAGDARSIADAYIPRHRGRKLPSVATFYNVALLGDGAIVSLDALLQDPVANSRDWMTVCRLLAVRASASKPPSRVSACRARSVATFLASIGAERQQQTNAFDNCLSTFSDADVQDILSAEGSDGRAVLPNVFIGEVGADPSLIGYTTVIPPCLPDDGWVCAPSHGLNRAPDSTGERVHISASFVFLKEQLLRAHPSARFAATRAVKQINASSTSAGHAAAAYVITAEAARSVCAELAAGQSSGPFQRSPPLVPMLEDVLHLDGPDFSSDWWWMVRRLFFASLCASLSR